MNIGKLGAGVVLSSLGAYVAGIPYNLGLVFMGAVIVLSGSMIVGWESIKQE